MADRRWRRPLRETIYGRAVAPSVPTDCCCVQYVVEGSSASAGQTSLALAHGSAAMGANSLGMPVPTELTTAEVAVSWLSDSAPSGDWTLTLQVREPGALVYTNAATLTVLT